MTRTSLLTTGLDALADTSPTVARMLTELYAMDDVLQEAHQEAKRDDENGERVVAAYQKFLDHREAVIIQLQKEKIAVPWQLRMRIDDIELTLKQRKEKNELVKPQERKQASAESASNTNASTVKGRVAGEGNNNDDEKKNDPLLLLKAMILPSVFMAFVAALVYLVASFAQ